MLPIPLQTPNEKPKTSYSHNFSYSHQDINDQCMSTSTLKQQQSIHIPPNTTQNHIGSRHTFYSSTTSSYASKIYTKALHFTSSTPVGSLTLQLVFGNFKTSVWGRSIKNFLIVAELDTWTWVHKYSSQGNIVKNYRIVAETQGPNIALTTSFPQQ